MSEHLFVSPSCFIILYWKYFPSEFWWHYAVAFWFLSICVEKPNAIWIPDLFGYNHCFFCSRNLLILFFVSDKFHKNVLPKLIFIHCVGHNQGSWVVFNCYISLVAFNLEQFPSLSFSFHDTDRSEGSVTHVLKNVSKVVFVSCN